MTQFYDSNMDKYMEQVKTTVHFIYWHVILCDHRANLLEGECRIPMRLHCHKMIWNVHTFVADFNTEDWRHFLCYKFHIDCPLVFIMSGVPCQAK